ncbi:P-loop NTPase fold protein [Pseudomonas sp. dw_358]|uniref:P-loop NTPase fold protein n=1 Tax=Pseudomonas sp. dw_358 TaxID=2720083 RepID=UPI001BD28985|nr:P-loop NTPase fold protein [Pseudomonas sp. dw_358]
MSVAQVKKALYDFSVHKTGSAIVLKGEWGTGKTFLWNQVIKANRTAFVQPSYSYVSLFGVNSLTDLKISIFENTVPCVKANDVTSKDSIIANLVKLDFSDAMAAARKGLGYTKEAKIPFAGSIAGVVESIQYSMISQTLVCIDDFERRGASLTARDVLGLISNMIEEKKCSVILILNDGSLQKDDEFFTFSEKVFDYEVNYAPTLDEAASIVFDYEDPYYFKVVENSKKLKINNIRLLRKVKYFSDLIRPFVDGKPNEILDAATMLVPLAIYAKYSGSEKSVDIDDLENYKGGFSLHPAEQKDLTPEQKVAEEKKLAKQAFLHGYGYGEADEFTFEIVKLVKNGYADSDSLSPLIDSISVTVAKNRLRQKIISAWHTFHHDITISDEALLLIFETAVRDSGDITSPYEIDGVLEIFIAAGFEERGKTLVDDYFEVIRKSRPITHRREMYKLPQNSYVVQRLDEYFGESNKIWTLAELVEQFHGRPVTGEVLELLSDFTDDEFYDYFKSLSPLKFVSYAESLLFLGSRTGLPASVDYYKIVFIRAFTALLRIHDESPLMALRMNKFMEYRQMYDEKLSVNH